MDLYKNQVRKRIELLKQYQMPIKINSVICNVEMHYLDRHLAAKTNVQLRNAAVSDIRKYSVICNIEVVTARHS